MKKLILLFFTTVLFTVVSCDKTEPSETGTEGTLSGTVRLFDEGTQQLSNDNMVVSIFGSNPLISDTTDSDGKFSFSKLSYGTYSIDFHKIGYGQNILNSVYHNSASTTISTIINLGQHSSTHTTVVSAKDTLGSIFIYVTTDPVGSLNNSRYIRIYFHNSDMVSSENYTNYSDVLESNTNTLSYRINPHALEDMGFKSGETVWVKAYGESYYSNDFIDPVKGKHIFPNLNLHSAAAISFIVP